MSSNFLSGSSQLPRRILRRYGLDREDQTCELFRLECLTVDPLAGAVAMQCPLIRRRSEFPNAPKNRGDFRHI